MREVEYNETVSRCVRPLHRVCPGDRVRREVNTTEREEVNMEMEEVNKEKEEDSSGGPSCKYYNETVCIKKGIDATHDNTNYKGDCQLLEVRCT